MRGARPRRTQYTWNGPLPKSQRRFIPRPTGMGPTPISPNRRPRLTIADVVTARDRSRGLTTRAKEPIPKYILFPSVLTGNAGARVLAASRSNVVRVTRRAWPGNVRGIRCR